jgi:hypothetical protein
LHRVERFKYLEIFEGFPQGVHVGVFWRLRVARKIRRSSIFEVFEENSGRLISLKYSREDKEQTLVQKAKFLRGFRGKNWTVKILCGESSKQRGP